MQSYSGPAQELKHVEIVSSDIIYRLILYTIYTLANAKL
jgi:hypothetical protein